jgi:hypothetical protein
VAQWPCSTFEPVKGVKIKRGWDFGLTLACVFTQVTPDGRLAAMAALGMFIWRLGVGQRVRRSKRVLSAKSRR